MLSALQSAGTSKREWAAQTVFVFCALLLLMCRAGGADQPLPAIQGHLTAPLKSFDPATRESLEEALGQVQQEAKTDLAVLVLSEPSSMPLDAWANRVFVGWSIGKEWSGGGILLCYDPKHRSLAVTQSSNSPLSEPAVQVLKRSASTGQLKTQDTILRVVARARRMLTAGPERPRWAPPLKRDPARAANYAVGALVTTFIALYLTWLKRSPK